MGSKERLIEVLSLPSYSGKESIVSNYIINFCKENNIETYTDIHGNVYATKGVSDIYPCVVAHMDTVHEIRKIIVKEREQSSIHPGILYAVTEDDRQTGIGGDDKAGIFVCLELLLHFGVIKAAFFVAEEVGCLGSYLSDKHFFENVGYAIQFDAPFNNWVSWYSDGEKLFNIESEFFEKIEPIFIKEMPEYDRKKCLGSHPYTDVCALKRLYDFSCINYSVGYYDMHSHLEYVIINETFGCLEMAKNMVKSLGNKKYPLNGVYLINEEFKNLRLQRLASFKQ